MHESWQGVVTEDENIIFAPKLIALQYVKGWFVIDFLSSIPFDFLIKTAIGRSS